MRANHQFFGHSIIFLIFFCSSFKSWAQLKADFTIDNPGGCSPLTAAFTNTTTGASSAATYQWNFGNGNADGYLKDAFAVYSVEKSYTVMLTVRDGSQTSTVQKTVTVYKKPVVDFSFSPAKGCAPLPVTFKADATPGDGTINIYAWDFGDGNVDNSNAATVTHSYTATGNPPVRLTVVNSYGCLATLDKSGPAILPELKADFDVSETALCTVGQSVNFTNKSSGPGTLSYTWDLGEGKSADTKDASNKYDNKGVFGVSLIVISTEGCADTLKKTGLINVANFTTDFTIPVTVCTNASVEFNNNSTPNPASTVWTVTETGANIYASNFFYTFPAAGTYNIKMTNTYGSCSESVTKEVVVKSGPAVTNFIADLNGVCGAPITVLFRDTSQTAVAWNWNFGTGNATDNKKETSYTYNNDGTYNVQLTVTDAQGCVNKISKVISLSKPDIQITQTGDNSGCPGLTKTFGVNVPADQIKTYEWNFGDGGTSAEASPSYVFNKPGTFAVTLKYTTQGDCAGTTAFYAVMIQDKPKADFSITATEICGASPAAFTNLTTGNIDNWSWDFGDGNWAGSNTPIHYYNQAGEYTVTLIAGNGSCRDTVQKTGFIKVLPPFPKTNGYTMSCNSGEVTFYQDVVNNAAIKMWWDFGDGKSQDINPASPTTVHVYDSSKTYKAYLFAENGSCTVKDSIVINVLQRQHPVLEATLTEICGSGNLNIKISGLERNPSVFNDYYSHYTIYGWRYADGTMATPVMVNQQNIFITEFSGTITNLENGQSGISVIIQPNSSPGCLDTSNIIPLVIKGPKAKFSYATNNTCFKNPILFRDESIPDTGIPIKSWVWDFNDAEQYTHTDTNYPVNGLVPHLYANPGYYYSTLTVTDADGCIGKTPTYGDYAIVKGPKAGFSYSPDKVFPGTTVYFYNNTNYANSSPQFSWNFTNGTPTYNGQYPPSKTYNALGRDSITLIAKDPTGCTDTAIQVLYIKDVAASFSYTENYISNSSCPPVIISFTSTSENAQRLVWDFGTGASDNGNRQITNHTYYKPGVYRVVLYAYGNSTYVDSSVIHITIKGPYAILTADTLSGCLNQKVTLSADVKNASSFTWDFGDGSLQQTTDTFTTHNYARAGIYTPALVLKDGAGCSGTSELQDKIIIDSLAITRLQKSPARICDSAMVLFNPTIKSIAAEILQRQLIYEWDYGAGTASITTTDSATSYFYNRVGVYEVSLSVSSPYGCVKNMRDSVKIIQTPHSYISGPASICQDGTALFKGSADMTTPINWKWNFNNGNSAAVQNPELQLYTNPEDQVSISLITDNQGCSDSAVHLLTVYKRPDVNLTPKQTVVCLGNSISLHANDGTQYKWDPAPGLSSYNIANPIASPADNTVYYVEVTNAFGCKRTDSASITVAKPFRINLVPDTHVCYGSTVQLPATGADSYQWINSITGLSSTTVNAPLASPIANTTYTVVGYDRYNCFTDTAKVNVEVKPLPWVKAPENMELPTGSEVDLPTTASNDVLQWTWSPVDYLDCARCSNPVSRPRSDIDYIVTVKNQFGCLSSDTVSLKLVCAKGFVYIPNAFTPNNDKKNDVFYVKGRGIRSVKSMRVFNRWGEVVFETANVEIDDITKGWNGMYKGREAESAAYVYFIELICDTGEIFSRKGTVTLIR